MTSVVKVLIAQCVVLMLQAGGVTPTAVDIATDSRPAA